MRSIDFVIGLGLVILFIWVSYLNVQVQQNNVSLISYISSDIMNSVGVGNPSQCPELGNRTSVFPVGGNYDVLYLEKERKLCFYEVN